MLVLSAIAWGLVVALLIGLIHLCIISTIAGRPE
jgi:hypothetical protein